MYHRLLNVEVKTDGTAEIDCHSEKFSPLKPTSSLNTIQLKNQQEGCSHLKRISCTQNPQVLALRSVRKGNFLVKTTLYLNMPVCIVSSSLACSSTSLGYKWEVGCLVTLILRRTVWSRSRILSNLLEGFSLESTGYLSRRNELAFAKLLELRMGS